MQHADFIYSITLGINGLLILFWVDPFKKASFNMMRKKWPTIPTTSDITVMCWKYWQFQPKCANQLLAYKNRGENMSLSLCIIAQITFQENPNEEDMHPISNVHLYFPQNVFGKYHWLNALQISRNFSFLSVLWMLSNVVSFSTE